MRAAIGTHKNPNRRGDAFLLVLRVFSSSSGFL